jgi:hypothetical protein
MLAGRGLEIEIEAILNIEILHSIPFNLCRLGLSNSTPLERPT